MARVFRAVVKVFSIKRGLFDWIMTVKADSGFMTRVPVNILSITDQSDHPIDLLMGQRLCLSFLARGVKDHTRSTMDDLKSLVRDAESYVNDPSGFGRFAWQRNPTLRLFNSLHGFELNTYVVEAMRQVEIFWSQHPTFYMINSP